MNTVSESVREVVGVTSDDEILVRECIEGDERAWSSLIDKYRNLIFSIPMKYGLSHDEAADVFQEVCLKLLSQLNRLREPRALPAWLIQVTVRECFHWNRQARHLVPIDAFLNLSSGESSVERVEDETLREQMLREAVRELADRCRQLVQMLFFSSPPVPYEQVARELRIAVGSVGFIRMQCLHRLRRGLSQKGFR
jgi:RNA polymerase sigma factor (sigma-70 family)